jgi:hypothetical protein
VSERIEILERRVDALEMLPARITAVESQIVQFRDEMRREFVATREELRAEIRAGDEGVRTELLAAIREGDEETRRYMRVLHEEVLGRIATINEGRRPRKR